MAPELRRFSKTDSLLELLKGIEEDGAILIDVKWIEVVVPRVFVERFKCQVAVRPTWPKGQCLAQVKIVEFIEFPSMVRTREDKESIVFRWSESINEKDVYLTVD